MKKKKQSNEHYLIQDETNGRDTVGTTRFDLSSTIGLLALATLDAVVGVILLGVHGGDDVDGDVDCVAFTRFANKTPSYCTPFSSIETTNCCSPDSEPADDKNIAINIHFCIQCHNHNHNCNHKPTNLPRLNNLNCMPDRSASGLHALRRSWLPL